MNVSKPFWKCLQSVPSLCVQLRKTMVLGLSCTTESLRAGRAFFKMKLHSQRFWFKGNGEGSQHYNFKIFPRLILMPARVKKNWYHIFWHSTWIFSYKALRHTSSGIPSGNKYGWKACHVWGTRKSVENKTDTSCLHHIDRALEPTDKEAGNWNTTFQFAGIRWIIQVSSVPILVVSWASITFPPSCLLSRY